MALAGMPREHQNQLIEVHQPKSMDSRPKFIWQEGYGTLLYTRRSQLDRVIGWIRNKEESASEPTMVLEQMLSFLSLRKFDIGFEERNIVFKFIE